MSVQEQTARGVRVYRFHDAVALNFINAGGYVETVYIPENLAHQFAALVQDVANDITMQGFGRSDIGTWIAEQDGEDKTASRLRKE